MAEVLKREEMEVNLGLRKKRGCEELKAGAASMQTEALFSRRVRAAND
jgi:hypothetical protein